MKKRKNLLLLFISMFFLLTFALTALSQEKPVAGQATQKDTQLQPMTKAPSIDPNLVRILQGQVSRSTMINVLMGNQSTRAMLENLANNAKLKTDELSIKTLDGNPVSPKLQGQLIDQLNWNVGIKISMIKNHPKFFYPPRNQVLSVGFLWSRGIFLDSESMSHYVNNDIFPMHIVPIPRNEGHILLYLYLPSTSATYMIAVHLISSYAPEMTIYDQNTSRNVPLVRFSGGWVGLTFISPHSVPGVINNCPYNCMFRIKLEPCAHEYFIWFHGFTITRL